METNKNTQAYETFCRLISEERLYIDPTLSFTTVCRWIGANPRALDKELERELGYSGDALIARFREQLEARLRDVYGLAR